MVLSFLKKVEKEIETTKLLEKESEGIPEIRKVYTERIAKLMEIKIDALLKQLESEKCV